MKGPSLSDLITTSLPVFPLRGGIVFPHMVITLRIESEAATKALAAAESTDGRLDLNPMQDGEIATDRNSAGMRNRVL